jgi:hypothetical protein
MKRTIFVIYALSAFCLGFVLTADGGDPGRAPLSYHHRVRDLFLCRPLRESESSEGRTVSLQTFSTRKRIIPVWCFIRANVC